jgi:acyl-coenzyme A thioesterase PaaI-like protein
MPKGSAVLTVEYKINLLAPAQGERMVARGRVAKAGRTLTVCAGDVYSVTAGQEKLVATMLATMIALPDRADLSD